MGNIVREDYAAWLSSSVRHWPPMDGRTYSVVRTCIQIDRNAQQQRVYRKWLVATFHSWNGEDCSKCLYHRIAHRLRHQPSTIHYRHEINRSRDDFRVGMEQRCIAIYCAMIYYISHNHLRPVLTDWLTDDWLGLAWLSSAGWLSVYCRCCPNGLMEQVGRWRYYCDCAWRMTQNGSRRELKPRF